GVLSIRQCVWNPESSELCLILEVGTRCIFLNKDLNEVRRIEKEHEFHRAGDYIDKNTFCHADAWRPRAFGFSIYREKEGNVVSEKVSDKPVTFLKTSPSRRFLAVGNSEGNVTLYDLQGQVVKWKVHVG